MRRLLPFLAIVPLLGAACSAAPTVAPTPAAGNTTAAIEKDGLEDAAFVSIGPSGFSPSSITVKKGESVTWLNEDAGANHWPASAIHPLHTQYPGFDPKTPITPGGSWSFRFDTVGMWAYHDHLHPSTIGSITVTE